MKNGLKFLLLNAIVLVVALSFSSCGDDDPDPVFTAPELSLNGDAQVTLKPGADITVNFNIVSEGAISSIVVNRNGGFLEEIEISDPDATTFEYTGQTVPNTAIEGEAIAYEFIAVNVQDTESTPVNFEISVALYDLVSGSTVGDVYRVTIPEDNLVPSGTDILFAQGRSYLIDSTLSFASGSSLTIEEGVTVYLNAEAPNAITVGLTSGAGLEINGTATAPVVMTSSKLITGDSPEVEDWNRLEMNQVTNSTIRYLRMEYAGDRAFRLLDCDNTNDIAYVQVFQSSDEGIMITNGDVDLKYIVATETGDSNYRLGEAYSGRIQYAIAWNSEIDGGEAFYLRETSNVTMANVTVVGPGTDSGFGNDGIRLRSTTGGKVYNAVVTGMPGFGIRAQEVVPTDIDGASVFAYSHVYDNVERDDNDGNIFFDEASFMNSEDAIPGIGVGSILPTSTETSGFDPSSIDSFFDAASFKGAIENEANDWTVGWVKNPDGTIR